MDAGMIKWKIIQRPGRFSRECAHAWPVQTGVSKATVMQMIHGAENLSSICVCLTATCLTLASWQKDKIKINYTDIGDTFNRRSAK